MLRSVLQQTKYFMYLNGWIRRTAGTNVNLEVNQETVTMHKNIRKPSALARAETVTMRTTHAAPVPQAPFVVTYAHDCVRCGLIIEGVGAIKCYYPLFEKWHLVPPK